MQKQSARIKCKNNLFTVRSVKTTVRDQNNNILWYFHIFKAQESSKPGYTVQVIVQSGLLVLCTESTLFCNELPENYIYLNQSELSSFFMYLIRSKTASQRILYFPFHLLFGLVAWLVFMLRKTFPPDASRDTAKKRLRGRLRIIFIKPLYGCLFI